MTPEERAERIHVAREAFAAGARATHQLLDHLDGPTEAGVPVLFGLQQLDPLDLHIVATSAIGLLSLARQLLGADGWQQLRETHEAANLRALDQLARLDRPGPEPFIP